jgi:hypothetical protein
LKGTISEQNLDKNRTNEASVRTVNELGDPRPTMKKPLKQPEEE